MKKVSVVAYLDTNFGKKLFTLVEVNTRFTGCLWNANVQLALRPRELSSRFNLISLDGLTISECKLFATGRTHSEFDSGTLFEVHFMTFDSAPTLC